MERATVRERTVRLECVNLVALLMATIVRNLRGEPKWTCKTACVRNVKAVLKCRKGKLRRLPTSAAIACSIRGVSTGWNISGGNALARLDRLMELESVNYTAALHVACTRTSCPVCVFE